MGEARTVFLTALRTGLRGAPAERIDEVVSDYAAHFDEGAATNRSTEEIAQALGDPLALADELRVELGIERWEANPSSSSAFKVISGAIALGALNVMLVSCVGPVLLLLASAACIAMAALIAAGIWFLLAGRSLGLPGGILSTLLIGFGQITAAVSLAALTTLAASALVNLVARYARVHYRLLNYPVPRK